MNKSDGNGMSRRDVAIAILVLGSVWGLLEVGVGGAMKSASIPYKGDILTGLGIGLMAVLLALARRPAGLVGVAVVAVAVKQLAVPILGLSFMCKANSCLAVGLAGGALAGASAVAGARLHRSVAARVATGVAAGLVAGTAFYAIGMRVAPCQYLLSFNRQGGYVDFMAAEGLIWAALGGVFLPLGYRVGLGLNQGLVSLRARRPLLYYSVSLAIVAVAWVASGLAIAAGL
ncbi:MAG: hypothetical protein WAW06_12695 [bacterium]